VEKPTNSQNQEDVQVDTVAQAHQTQTQAQPAQMD